jgi:HAD superfamily hydrolase (TIGR01509 family)
MKDITVLFDFDGVIADTETLYTEFWNAEGMKYFGEENFGIKIKGQTWKHISKFFEKEEELAQAMHDIDEFERNMPYDLVPGALEFICSLKEAGVPTAIVTSSHNKKMANAWRVHPGLKEMVTTVLTSNDFTASKPNPECFLKAMERLGARPERTVVFEDSIHGIEAGRAAGALVVGLCTTFPREKIEPICDMVIDDFTQFRLEDLFESKIN